MKSAFAPGVVAFSFAACLAMTAVMLPACSGIAIIDFDGEGGDGTTTTVTTTTITTTTTTTITTTTTTTTSTNIGLGGQYGGGPPEGGAPPIPPLVELPQGNVTSGTAHPVAIPPEARGMVVYGSRNGPFQDVGIETLTAPDAVDLIVNHEIPNTLASYDFSGIVTVNVPMTDRPQEMPFLTGTWNVTLSGPGMPLLDVWYRQTVDGQFHGGVIDVNVYRTSNAASEDYFSQIVGKAFNGFNGIFLDNIRYFPLDEQFATIDDNNWFDTMAETADAPGKPVLNIILVEFIDLQGSAGVIGFSPGVPGNPLEKGTIQSAVVLWQTGDPLLDALVVRHEAGHFAGLIHTSEVIAGMGDLLDDTPFCPDVQNMGGGCPDYDYVMFPYADPGTAFITSPKQVQVWQRGPMYRAAVEAGGGVALPLDGTMAMAAAPDFDASPHAAVAGEWGMSAFELSAHRAWRATQPSDLGGMLAALWCGNALGNPYDVLAGMGADAATMLAIGADPGAAPYARLRALAAVGRLAPTAAQTQALLSMAADTALPPLVRIGAIDGAAVADVQALRSLGLAGDLHPGVARVASRR